MIGFEKEPNAGMMHVDQRPVYMGSVTGNLRGAGKRISLAWQDPATGALSATGVVAAGSPMFLEWHPSGRYLYAVNADGSGAVSAYTTKDDGGLRPLGTVPSGGKNPCHVTVHPSGRYVLVANYGGGSVSVFPVGADGGLRARCELVVHEGSGSHPVRQASPHPHQVCVDPSGRWVLVADLGLDAILLYRFDQDTGQLAPAPTPRTAAPAGAGPRHIVFGARDVVYGVGELDSTMLVLAFDPSTGALQLVETMPSTAAPVGEGNFPSEIALSTDGRFCYVANRGIDCVTALAVDGHQVRPLADVPTGGAWPRHLAVTGDHLYIANERSNTVTHFRLDPATGVPEPASDPLETPGPTCVQPAPATPSADFDLGWSVPA